MTHACANPFYAARLASQPRYARLPRAPRNASPVPHLTSLYHFDQPGDYGDRSYPGNCGGLLIRDLLRYFQPSSVFDPMSGSGTCLDVCRELGIPCTARDLRDGFDATDPAAYATLPEGARFEFIWAHPPYWRQKLYTPHAGDLSRAPTLDAFLQAYQRFIAHGARLLTPHGIFAILMGDYHDRQAGFVPLTYHTKRIALACGLRPHATDIIRFSHGASSSRHTYRSRFIPGLHDVCMLFEPAASG